jgi:EmrB/QacA subfamily drug resistance transporter
MSDPSPSPVGDGHQQVPSALSHAEIMRVMVGVMTCILLAALDQTVVIPALPAIGDEFGSYSQLSWIVAAYLITSTISTPIYSKLSDIHGRRRLLIACIAAFIATSMLCALAQSLNQLVWFRALQGLGGGGLMALTQAAMADVMSPRERGRYQSYVSIVWAVASVSGPLVGGFVVQSLSWRWIFWINLPIGLAAMWACHNGLQRLALPIHAVKPKLDIVGMVLLSGALSLFLLALGWGGKDYPWDSYEILGLLGISALLLLLLILQELQAHDPLLPPRLFASKSYVANVIVSTSVSLLLFMCLFTIPLYFQLARGATAAQSGIYLAPFMLASTAGNVVASRFARRSGTMRGAMRVASFVACAGLIVLAILPPDAPAWMIVTAMLVTAPGIGGCFISSMIGSQNALGPRDIGSGTGALLVLRAVGGACGSTIAGAIIASGMTAVQNNGAVPHLGRGFGMAYAVAAMIAAASFAVSLWMPNTKLREVPHHTPLAE